LRSDIDGRFCESVDADSLDSCLRNREGDAPDGMCAKFFFEPGFGLPKVDFARCKRGRECCQEAAHVSAHQDLHPTEVTI
jgi:hypothetical protein